MNQWIDSFTVWRYVADLIHFGAVHYALVCPQPPPTATPEQIRLFKKFTEPTFLKGRKSIKGKTMGEAQKTFRITHIDDFVEVGMYLRVYVHPKRFPRWKQLPLFPFKNRMMFIMEWCLLKFTINQVLWNWLEIKNYRRDRILCGFGQTCWYIGLWLNTWTINLWLEELFALSSIYFDCWRMTRFISINTI